MVDIKKDRTKVIKSFTASQVSADFLQKLVGDGINISAVIDNFLLKARSDWLKLECNKEIDIVHLDRIDIKYTFKEE